MPFETRFTYRVEIAYDGTGFAGFQAQPGQRTIESTLLSALDPLSRTRSRISVGGRTDRGVHARAQVVSFWTREQVALEHIAAAIDSAAPDELSVLDIRTVPRWFHAQFCALARHYVYWHKDQVDPARVARMQSMLGGLMGRRCFSAFARDTPKGHNTVRRLLLAGVRSEVQGVRFDFKAEGFLRHMVRILVATALREAHAGADDEVLCRLAATGARQATASPAPAHGLTLHRIHY